MGDLFAAQRRLLADTRPIRLTGRVGEVMGLTVTARGLPLPVGANCRVINDLGKETPAQVIAVRGADTVLMTMEEPLGVARGHRVYSTDRLARVAVGEALLGRILNGLGEAIDGRGVFSAEGYQPIHAAAPSALDRRPIDCPLATGVRAIDGFLTLGEGQRVGIFAGTGVGKSVLLGMITRMTDAEVNVVALVGERGREVGDFIHKALGPEGLKRTVVVVSTSDESPLLRVRAGFVATAVAEFFRDRGRRVLLLMDSVTRIAQAQRQIGLAAGEPPATRAFPPSVFALLPRLMERCGRTREGSITGLYTVLVEADDLNDPIGDATRGILDGHIWLSRDLAHQGHYPAISVLESISRVMTDVAGASHLKAAGLLRSILATWVRIEDMVNLGAYTQGMNPEFDLAMAFKDRLFAVLRQDMNERCPLEKTREAFFHLAAEAQAWKARRTDAA